MIDLDDLETEGSLLVLLPFVPKSMLAPVILRALALRGLKVHLAVMSPTAGSYEVDDLRDFELENRLLKLWMTPQQEWFNQISDYIIRNKVSATLMIGAYDLYRIVPMLKEKLPSLINADLLYNPIGHTTNHFLFEKGFDCVVTESAYMAAVVRTSTKINDRRIYILTSGVDLDRFKPSPRSNSKPFVVGYVGRFSEEKNPLGFFDIIDNLFSDLPNLNFYICGSGPLEEAVKARVSRLSNPQRCEYAGFVPDVADAYSKIDLLVVPSRDDGRPVSIMEANACGIPVLATRVGGIPEMINDGENGYLFNLGSFRSASDIVVRLASDPVEFFNLTVSSRNHAIRNFGLNGMFDGYENMFRQLLNRPNGQHT